MRHTHFLTFVCSAKVKSVVVRECIKNLNQMRKNVAVVCLCYYEVRNVNSL